MTRRVSGTWLGLFLLASGCISARSYVDPTFPSVPKVTAASLRKSDAPPLVDLQVAFLSNGTPNARGAEFARKRMAGRLDASGVVRVAPSSGGGAYTLRVTMENLGDTNTAFSRGFVTGLTFGLSGSSVTEFYVFDAALEQPGRAPVKLSLKHTITSVTESGEVPAGQQAMRLEDAILRVLDELVDTMLRDFQAKGLLLPQGTPGQKAPGA
jgi:hypothetical protein